jgi:hypothetical protein
MDTQVLAQTEFYINDLCLLSGASPAVAPTDAMRWLTDAVILSRIMSLLMIYRYREVTSANVGAFTSIATVQIERFAFLKFLAWRRDFLVPGDGHFAEIREILS